MGAGASSTATATGQRRRAATRRPATVPASDQQRVSGLAKLLAQHKRTPAPDPFVVQDDTYKYDCTKDGMYFLKQLYKGMDPTVLKPDEDGDFLGDIKLSFKYNDTTRRLLVKVVSARHLRRKDIGKSVAATANPFVKLDIVRPGDNDYHHEDEEGDRSSKSTNVVENNLSPNYNEIFSFPVEEGVLRKSKLKVSVWHHDDHLGVQHDFMGEVILDFSNFNLSHVVTEWFTLKPETDLRIGGVCELSLDYRAPNALSITIHQAAGLLQRDKDNKPNTSLRVFLSGTNTIKETKVFENSCDPVWEETFQFKIPQEELEYRSVVCNVYEKTREGVSTLGQLVIDLSNLDVDRGYKKGKFQLADLRHVEVVRSKESQVHLSEEFCQALYAHTVCRHPQLLFGKQDGNKVLKVRSKKGRSVARLRLVNGVPL